MKKLNTKKNINKLEIPGKVKKGYRIYVMAVLALTLTMSMGVTAFAAGDPLPSSTTSATLSSASSVRSA
mgnify:CR=1 FL=1